MLITVDILSRASTTIEKMTGFKPTIEVKALRVCDSHSLTDEFNAKLERRQNLIRELALQGQPLDADDAGNVIDLVIQILSAESFAEQAETLFHAVVAEWLERSACRQELLVRIAEVCEVAGRDFIYTKGLTKGKEGTSTWICCQDDGLMFVCACKNSSNCSFRYTRRTKNTHTRVTLF